MRAVQEMKEMIHTQGDDSAEEIEAETREKSILGVSGGKSAEDTNDNDEEVGDESTEDTIEVSKPKRGRPKGSKKKP